MTRDQIQTNLQKSLGFNIEKLAEKAGTEAHNIKQAWDATVTKVEEFTSKYVN